MSGTKKIVRVYLVDETKFGLAIDDNTSALQLAAMVSQRIGLVDYSHFGIFEMKNNEERCLSPDEKPVYISERWSSPQTLKASTSDATNSSFLENRLVFKKKIFVRDEDEQDNKEYDPKAKHLLYLQALSSVIDGEYPCCAEDAVRLAALHAQVEFGDFNPGTHVPGFFGQTLGAYIPAPLIASKPAKDWENLIFKHHMGKKGLPAEDAETEYLNTVKAWPHYGTKYFKNCRVLGSKSKLSGKVMIGVNLDGIVLANNKEKDQIFSTHLFTDLLSWTTSPQNGAQNSFTFEVSTNGNDPVKYSFETRHADAINDLVQSYVDVLIYMIKLDIGNETASPRE